jgi:hypothetical protein
MTGETGSDPEPDRDFKFYSFFCYARNVVISQGFQEEIEWCQNRMFDQITSDEFLVQYRFAVFSSSGLNNKVVMKIQDAFDTTNKAGMNAFETIPNRRMREAIVWMQTRYREVFRDLKLQKTDADKIQFLQGLKQIGPKESRHLARNLGIDCIKPDRHMDRMAEHWGYASPDAMCMAVQKYEKERLGVIDVILWRYTVLTGEYE